MKYDYAQTVFERGAEFPCRAAGPLERIEICTWRSNAVCEGLQDDALYRTMRDGVWLGAVRRRP